MFEHFQLVTNTKSIKSNPIQSDISTATDEMGLGKCTLQ